MLFDLACSNTLNEDAKSEIDFVLAEITQSEKLRATDILNSNPNQGDLQNVEMSKFQVWLQMFSNDV